MTVETDPHTTDPLATDPLATIDGATRERLLANRVASVDELHELNGEPHQMILEKHTSYLTPLLAQFISMSPLYFLATSHEDGSTDVSPRGDPAGEVKILDSRTIFFADRAGNRRLDSFRNIVARPYVGLCFVVPPVEEVVRINGRATITRDEEFLAGMVIQDRTPVLGVVVEIDEVYGHCSRALLRSKLFAPERWADPDQVPTLRAIISEQKELPTPDESAGKRQEEYRNFLG
jgi:PPOX class probable FMN-dependent enzyme